MVRVMERDPVGWFYASALKFSEVSIDPTDRLLINIGGEESEMKQETVA